MNAQPPRPAALVRDHFLGDHDRLELLLEELVVASSADDRAQIQHLWRDFDVQMTR